MRRGRTVTISVALIGLSALWVVGIGTPGSFNLPTPFSASRWKASSGWHKNRCSMVYDLTHRVGIAGRTQREIVSLLGVPDMQVDGSKSVYLLCQSLGDIYVLELTWRQGRVASIQIKEF